MSGPRIVLMETPRDAFQGIREFIPTEEKIAHISLLAEAGFRCIDFGSFVSPRAVPQMRDSEAVLQALAPLSDLYLCAVVVNEKGLDRALAGGRVNAVGFPFSVSDTFQRRNTGKGIDATWGIFSSLVREAHAAGKDFLLYVSMAFGNPYGEPWSLQNLEAFVSRCCESGLRTVYLADTTSEADPDCVREVMGHCSRHFPAVEWGVHLHSDSLGWPQKLSAALDAGARRVDSAVLGLGGCPFARNSLVGNIPSEGVVEWLESHGIPTGVNRLLLARCVENARHIAETYGAC